MPRLIVTLSVLMLLSSCATTPTPAERVELAPGEKRDARGAKAAPPDPAFSHIEIGGGM